MAKTPPKRYAPGELEKTRGNLGELTKEEAHEMALILGGEVGVERSKEIVEEQYLLLQEQNRRRHDRIIQSAPLKIQFHGFKLEKILPQRNLEEDFTISYITRMRMNFHASRPEYHVMSRWEAFKSLLSLVSLEGERAHHRFITGGDDLFYNPIEELVLSVRNLLSRNRKSRAHNVRNPFYLEILEILKNWNIEGLHRELSSLQRHPRQVRIFSCRRLCNLIYVPIISLSRLDPDRHIIRAIRELKNKNLLTVPAHGEQEEKILDGARKAEFAVRQIFYSVKERCYPLLMKLCSKDFEYYSDFFQEHEESILSCLKLNSEDLLIPPAETPEQTKETIDPLPEEREVSLHKEALQEIGIQKGIELLYSLFPKAGWHYLEEFPDLYPYFEPLFQLPKGSELISPKDPLQQVVVFHSILQQLFYGFHSISFGTRQDGSKLQPEIDEIIGEWHRFQEEYLEKDYLPRLQDYCRQIERNTEFASTEYGQRLINMLLWGKKYYLFPHLQFRPIGSLKTWIKEGLSKFFVLVEKLKILLTEIVLDLNEKGAESAYLLNSNSDMFFEIANPVSSRLTRYLEKGKKRQNTTNLIIYSLQIVLVLDFLLNHPESFYYNDLPGTFFRSEPGKESAPVYAVELLDTNAIIRKADAQSQTLEQKRHRPWLEEDDVPSIVQDSILLSRAHRRPLSAIELHPSLADDLFFDDAVECVRKTIRGEGDIIFRRSLGKVLILLSESTTEGACDLARRILDELQSLGQLYYAGICQLHGAWGEEVFLKTTRKAAEEAAKLPPPSASIYEPKHHTFQSL